MKLNIKDLTRFVGYYLLIIFVVNFVFAIFLYRDFAMLLDFFINIPKSLFFSFPCTIFPVDMTTRGEFSCPVDYGLILLNSYLAVLSLGLVFSKKLKFSHWVIAFIFFNLLILGILTFNNYLNWSWR